MINLKITYRPLDLATFASDGKNEYDYCRFRASWNQTMNDLCYELSRIDVDSIVLEVDVRENDIRLDGLPRANARWGSPAVRISFTAPDAGPLQFSCNTFDHWQDNVRAIVKTLERLRDIDRYGATRRQEQYRGFRALPPAGGGIANATDPVLIVAKHASMTPEQVRAHPATAARRARVAVHPDRNPSATDAAAVNAAADAVEKLEANR